MNLMDDISEYIQSHRKGRLPRKEAFEKALQCENMAIEFHFHDFFSNLPADGGGDILKMIQEQDKNHLERLKQYIKSRKI